MALRERASGALWLMVGGFVAIIALCWINEMAHSLGDPEGRMHFVEVFTESGIVIIVAIPSLILLRRSLNRLDYLEHLVSMCAWCRKVKYEGKWIPLTEFFKVRLRTETTHGICTACVEEQHADLAERRAQNAPLP